MTCLSGGQQSIVSLALIFAILMMDRSPFCLLDKADVVNIIYSILILYSLLHLITGTGW